MHPRRLALCGAAVLLVSCAPLVPTTPRPTPRPDAWVMSFDAAVSVWDGERARIGNALAVCPGPQQPLGFSASDALRDGIRQRPDPRTGATTADPSVLAARMSSNDRFVDAIQALALADWRMRRAASGEDPSGCQSARSALSETDAAMADARALATGPLPSAPPAATPGSNGTIRIAVRAESIEALPLLVARRTGLLDRSGLSVALVDAANGNPLDVPDVAAAVGTEIDHLSASADYSDVFAFYGRAPVALAVAPSMTGQDPGRLVVAAPIAGRSLAGLIARSRATTSRLRLVPDGAWFAALATFSAGEVDGVLDEAPLPQYLAAGNPVAWDASSDPAEPPVGAGSLFVPSNLDAATRDRLVGVFRDATAAIASTSDEDLTDLVAPGFRQWEPDAVLEMVRVAKRCLNPGGQVDPAAVERARQLVALDG